VDHSGSPADGWENAPQALWSRRPHPAGDPGAVSGNRRGRRLEAAWFITARLVRIMEYGMNDWYAASDSPEVVEFGPVRGLGVTGVREPGGDEHLAAIQALYGVARRFWAASCLHWRAAGGWRQTSRR
jgi:hypothetical protein